MSAGDAGTFEAVLRPPHRGLTVPEALARAAAGQANVDTSKLRSDGDVVRANTLTFFNLVLAGLIIALFAVGGFRDGFFVGIVVVANVAVATLQELRATRTLRELVALTAPHATVVRDGLVFAISADQVVRGDLLALRPGEQVVADGTILAGAAEIDESLLTGESNPVRKGTGDELRSGSFSAAGHCYYTAERVGLEGYAQSLTADARQLVKRATPLQFRVGRLVRVLLTATAILATLLLISYNVEDRGFGNSIKATTATVTTVVPIGLLLGMTVAFAVGAVRVSRAGAIVQDINAVEALNYTDVICLDKTGTITANRLAFADARWAGGEAGDVAGWLGAFLAASAGDSRTAGALAAALAGRANGAEPVDSVPFSSDRRWSANRLRLDGTERVFVLGAPETVLAAGESPELAAAFGSATEQGLRGVVFAEAAALPDPGRALPALRPLALLTVADVLRPEVGRAFALMRELGIEPKLISGDNPTTVSSLLRQLGLESRGEISGPELEALQGEAFGREVARNTVFGRIAPPLKARIVQALRDQDHFVAMVGDGANDVQALRAADVAVAMASGTSTTRAVAGIVLLNDSFEALVRGAKEATAVLGNAALLNKLFVAKSFYAFLLIVATNMLGLDFPFLPRHGSLTALLTLGIPAIFISISVPPPGAGRDFTRSVLRFALPASAAVAAAAISVHLFTEGLLGRDIEQARTLVSLTLGITGLLLVVEVLGFEGASFQRPARALLTTALVGVLLGALVFTVYTPWLRSFFDFTEVSAFDWTVVGVASAGALAGQFALTRYWQDLLDIVVAEPGSSQRLRGRAV